MNRAAGLQTPLHHAAVSIAWAFPEAIERTIQRLHPAVLDFRTFQLAVRAWMVDYNSMIRSLLAITIVSILAVSYVRADSNFAVSPVAAAPESAAPESGEEPFSFSKDDFSEVPCHLY